LGCSANEQASVVPVTGKVLFEGKPLSFGSVTFQPSRGQPAHGTIGPNGDFRLSTYREGDGAAVGRHKVKIACYSSQDPAAHKADSLPSESLGTLLIPERYTGFDTSGLEVAVLSGGNKPFVFELKAAVDEKPANKPANESDSNGEGTEASPPATDRPSDPGNGKTPNAEDAASGNEDKS